MCIRDRAGRIPRKCGDVAGAKMWGRLQVLENVGTSPDVPTFFPGHENVGTSPKCGDVVKCGDVILTLPRFIPMGMFPVKHVPVGQRVMGDGRITRNVALAHGFHWFPCGSGGRWEKMPRAMALMVVTMVASAASTPKMWGRHKMWGRRPFHPKCGDVKKCGDVVRCTQNVGTSYRTQKCRDVDRMWGCLLYTSPSPRD